MNKYEQLQEEACKDGIDVIDYAFKGNIKGLYCDGTVAIRKDIETTNEKTCVLAEELGHHHTTVGDIIDITDIQNRKQERKARLWGYNRLIGLSGLISAYRAGCHNSYEIAEYLDVTEAYLTEAVECYRDKYGICTRIGEYVIYFIPHLMIGKLI